MQDVFLDASRHIVDIDPIGSAIATGAIATGTSLFALLSVPFTRKRILPNPETTHLVNYLPFSYATGDDRFIRLKSGALSALIEVPGLATAGLPRSERSSLFHGRRAWIERFRGTGAEIRTIHRRRRTRYRQEGLPQHKIRAEIFSTWHDQFHDSFTTSHAVNITIPGRTEHAQKLIAEHVQNTVDDLRAYGAREVPVLGRKGHEGMTAASFWADIANPGNRSDDGSLSIARGRRSLDRRIYGGPVEVDHFSGLIVYEGVDPIDHTYAYIVGCSEWESTPEALIKELLSLNAELTVFQTYKILDDVLAETLLDRKGKSARSVRTNADIEEQIEASRTMVSAGATISQKLAFYEIFIVCHGRTPEEAANTTRLVGRTFKRFKMRPVTARLSAQAIWFSQFPSYFRQVHETWLYSQNVAELTNFETAPTGLQGSDFGPVPLALFTSSDQLPFSFSFHAVQSKEQLGHTVVIGPARSGKTSVMTFVATCALEQYPDLRVFMLDRDRGALVWTASNGGRYVSLSTDLPGQPKTRFQPLQAKLTASNVAHLRLFLKSLTVGVDPKTGEFGPMLDDETGRVIESMLTLLPGLKPHDRTLQVLIDAAVPPNTTLRARLDRWIDRGPYAGVFQGQGDDVDIRDERLVTFDLTHVLEDPVLAGPFLLELFHRIDEVCVEDAAPSLVIIDETAPALQNPMLRDMILEKLLRGGKKRQVLVLMFQEPAAMDGVGDGGRIAKAIRENSPTVVMFRNHSAKPDDYRHYGINDLAWRFIKGETHHELGRGMLVFQPLTRVSVVLDVDFEPLGDLKWLFKSGSQFSAAAISRMASGEDWVPGYIDDAIQIELQSGTR